MFVSVIQLIITFKSDILCWVKVSHDSDDNHGLVIVHILYGEREREREIHSEYYYYYVFGVGTWQLRL